MKITEFHELIYKDMTDYLENMCAYLAIEDEKLFRYYAGKADACKSILEEYFNFREEYAEEHIKAMFEIMDINW